MFSRILYALILGLVGAAIVHVVVLLLIPLYSERDAWSRLAQTTGTYEFVNLAAVRESGSLVKGADPLFISAACRIDLSTGYAHITARGDVPFWSVAIFNRKGQNIFSFNDRTASERDLDLVVTTPVQMVELRKNLPEAFSSSLLVEVENPQGIIVVRVFVPDPSWHDLTRSFLDLAQCRQY